MVEPRLPFFISKQAIEPRLPCLRKFYKLLKQEVYEKFWKLLKQGKESKQEIFLKFYKLLKASKYEKF